MAEAKKAIPKSFNLRSFFGDYVEERRSMQRCDVCGMPMKEPAKSPKPFVGAYLCDTCRRQIQQR